MREIRRAVARGYARDMGIDHLNKRRQQTRTVKVGEKERKVTMPAKSRFAALWRRLLGEGERKPAKEIRKIEQQRDKNQRAATTLAAKRKLERQAKLNRKAELFPKATGAA